MRITLQRDDLIQHSKDASIEDITLQDFKIPLQIFHIADSIIFEDVTGIKILKSRDPNIHTGIIKMSHSVFDLSDMD